MIWFIKILVVLVLLFFAWIPFKEAGQYRFRGQGALLFEMGIYLFLAVIVLWLPSWFFLLSLIVGGFYFYSKHKN